MPICAPKPAYLLNWRKVHAGLDFSMLADVLVPNWFLSNPADFDLKGIHPLNIDLILEASLGLENMSRMIRCVQGWAGGSLWWLGCEASKLSKRLAMQVGVCETEALSQMYCLLGVTLMRQNARAILLRSACTPLHDC